MKRVLKQDRPEGRGHLASAFAQLHIVPTRNLTYCIGNRFPVAYGEDFNCFQATYWSLRELEAARGGLWLTGSR